MGHSSLLSKSSDLTFQRHDACLDSFLRHLVPLGLLVSLKHAPTEVTCSNLVTCYAAVVHLVEPFVCWFLHAKLVAVQALLLGQIVTIFYLLVQLAEQGQRRLEVRLGSQVVLWHVGIRLEQRVVMLLVDNLRVRFLYLG